MAQALYTGTTSQQASTALHLERRSEWVYFRANGERYIALPSGRSNRTYWVRADAAGCSCKWSQTMSTPCSHRIAVQRATEQRERRDVVALMADLTGGCRATGCGEDRKDGDYCERHQLVDAF